MQKETLQPPVSAAFCFLEAQLWNSTVLLHAAAAALLMLLLLPYDQHTSSCFQALDTAYTAIDATTLQTAKLLCPLAVLAAGSRQKQLLQQRQVQLLSPAADTSAAAAADQQKYAAAALLKHAAGGSSSAAMAEADAGIATGYVPPYSVSVLEGFVARGLSSTGAGKKLKGREGSSWIELPRKALVNGGKSEWLLLLLLLLLLQH
jgi:hypothetical protein